MGNTSIQPLVSISSIPSRQNFPESEIYVTPPTEWQSLLKKYDVPGPRYTSYPTILHWSDNPTLPQWLQSVSDSLDAAEAENTGAAIYVHIPFCRSLCTYCGCNSRITQNTQVGGRYVKTVLQEWKLYCDAIQRQTPIPLTELHLGGGTPTYLSAQELHDLITGILEHVVKTPDAEFSIESDPRVTTYEQLAVLSELGFRRLSLGIQDFDPRVQRAVNRIQSEDQVRQTTESARELGFTSINYDLIYGLPFQTQQSIRLTVDAVKRLRPERIAFYAYAHVPWVKPGQRHFTEADLPTGDEKRALYDFGREILLEAGYREIGMDHFALPDDSLWGATLNKTLHRNFMGYTSRYVAPLIGLGVSSISDSGTAFAQNEKDLETYGERVERGEIPVFRGHKLSAQDRILRRHVLNLMTRFETEWSEPALYVPFLNSVNKRLIEPVADKLVILGEKRCEVTDKGRAFLRNICMAFDSHLRADAPGKQLFSRTI
jgi:oxygen-independent coproporphyrinogen-3 oxidase